ncbi:MAG: ribonuclease E/G [Candidatus Methanofastidiosa archaeon]|nr:ribonuclease E/G [Candidatus Methanofastidiosa archaeon]
MTSIRIRGIYTTALTKFFVEKGHYINQMSDMINDRFSDQETSDVPSVDIKHTKDLQGISIVGDKDSLLEIENNIRDEFVDVFFLKSDIDLYGIYKGSVIKTNNETIVNLGKDIGILPEYTSEDIVLVQVLEMNDKPLLTTRITFSGKYSVIIPEDDIKISRKIRDESERERLTDIGKKVKPNNFGILWRTSSENVDEDVLSKEAIELAKNASYVRDKFSELEGPGLIKPGKSHMKVLFGGQAKDRLDEIRGVVSPTIAKHHMMKSAGRDVSFAVDMIENIKGKRSIDDIDTLFLDIFRQIKGPKIGDEIVLDHIKPSSHSFTIEGGKVKNYNPPYIKIKRVFTSRGVYDGLDVKKEPGDYAITEMEEGKWHFINIYYDKNNKVKGEYINICTPIEIFPNRIRYIDLEVDVIKYPNGDMRIIDQEHLNKRVKEGVYTEKLAQMALKEAEEVIKTYGVDDL